MQRTFMIQFREKNQIDILSMAKKCKISLTLLELLEESDEDVTHPKIAQRIGKAYKLDKKQIEGLMPEHYRKSSPNYNPNLYKQDDKYEYGYQAFEIARKEMTRK